MIMRYIKKYISLMILVILLTTGEFFFTKYRLSNIQWSDYDARFYHAIYFIILLTIILLFFYLFDIIKNKIRKEK